LGAFFAAYLEDSTELRKQRMSTLLVQADARGLLGPGAVQPLAVLFTELQAELGGDAQRFAAFYHFVFFVARERGHRNLSCSTAVDGWGFVLGGGRFALLGPWCDFVTRRAGTKGISEDTWCQVRAPPWSLMPKNTWVRGRTYQTLRNILRIPPRPFIFFPCLPVRSREARLFHPPSPSLCPSHFL